MSETTALLFDLIIWCQVIALVLNVGVFAWMLFWRKVRKEERKWRERQD